MVNIEVRQNGVFGMGYPYNASVDSYFQSLSSDFISNYGLDTITVNAINDHKNTTLQFDRDLHDFIIKLSAFIIGFETSGKIMIEEYEALKEVKAVLEARQFELENNKSSAVTEFEFVTNNIEQITLDIEKINDIIMYYQSQIVDDTYVYNSTYIEDTNLRLSLLDGIITQNTSDSEYYKTTLYTETEALAAIKTKVIEFNFIQTTLRALYESWIKRDEEYYQKLVAYYKDEYESTWTYGISLMYGETLDMELSETRNYNLLADKWQETLFKDYNFRIEKELKDYSLSWLNLHPTFEEMEFILAVETRRKTILDREIVDVEQIIISKLSAVRSVFSLEKENNFYKYRELIQEKRKYVFMHISDDSIDQAMLDNYDSQMNLIVSDYREVEAKLAQKTYWQYYADLERYQELLIDLRRQLDKTVMAISRDFQNDATSNAEFIAEIEFYTAEKTTMEMKIVELTTIKDQLELDNNVYSDELTLIDSRLYENSSLISEKIAQYTMFFNDRIPFFTQNITVSENEGIVELLSGNFFREFDTSYQLFLDYSSNIQWYNVDDRNKLKELYASLLNIVDTNLRNQWEVEFSHEILDNRKLGIYEYYFDSKIRLLFATINKHLLDETYSLDFIEDIKTMATDIKNIFDVYVEIAFHIKESITVMMNVFDYNDVFTFRISDGEETIENIKETFYGVLDGIIAFAYSKNIEYNLLATTVSDKVKIDQIWLDMEKKYV